MSNGKPFKARLGLDANNEKVVNIAQPEVGTDAVNLDYFVAKNTLQPFSASRTYPANFLVEYGDRIWKSRSVVPAGDFNQTMWYEIHAFGRWFRITGAYAAEPGDNLVVSTQSASVTVTLPTPEEGDVVFIADEGFAATNPIIVAPGTATINGNAGNYEINFSGSVCFVYVGGTWKANTTEKSTYQAIDVDFVAKPNSWNIISLGTGPRAVTLPAKPKDGQWVMLQVGGRALDRPVTVSSSPALIDGASTYVINRGFDSVMFIFNDGAWKSFSQKNESRSVTTTTPLTNQQIYIVLDSTTKTVTLPATTNSGDWVEVVVATGDEVSQNGSVIINAPAGQSFRPYGNTVTATTSYRVKKRGRVLFTLIGTEWNVVHLEDSGNFIGAVPGSACAKNSIYQLGTNAILPSREGMQIGDYVTYILDNTGSVTVTVNDAANEIITQPNSTLDTWVADDNKQFVTYFFNGWNGSKYSWNRIIHGDAYLKKTKNLSDLPDKAVSRTNLDVFSKGESDARFLALHGTADNAAQAANADKLDNYDSLDFILVKNRQAVAVDANTTNETRFVTNIGTPTTSDMWNVVTFLDTVVGTKQQLAMGCGFGRIGFRSWSGMAWTAWTILDQTATAAAADKLATARTIALQGDAAGSVSFDGSQNVSMNVGNVIAQRVKAIGNTLPATASDQWVNIGSVVISQVGGIAEFSGQLVNMPSSAATGQQLVLKGIPSEFRFRVKQNDAFGNNPSVVGYLYSYEQNSDIAVAYQVLSNSPTTVVNIWVSTGTTLNNYIQFTELSRSTDNANINWFNSGSPTTLPVGALTVGRTVIYSTNYKPSADKWTTARKITVSGGGISGEVTLDGSGDVSLPLTVSPSGIGDIPISQVTGLQTALDGKLATTGTASDSSKLGGTAAADYVKSTAATNTSEDPNTTVTPLIMTNHANGPDGGVTHWYISTNYYQTRVVGSNAVQFASKYSGGPAVSFRQKYSGTWTSWASVAAIVDGATYNINVSGNAATATTATSANQATKLTTPRTINGVAFDGTANITVADSTKLPLTGGTLTGDFFAPNVSLTTGYLYLESAKHVISYNDGGGNFNIRVGNTYAAGITEDGFASQVSFSQTSGDWSFNITSASQTIGQTPSYAIPLVISKNQIKAITGAAATPSYSFTNDATSGMYSTGTGLGFATAGALSFGITSTKAATFYGDVTINTNLTVSGNATVTGTLTTTAQATMTGGLITSGWLRSSGQVGWFSQDYGGGWYMIDTTWVRAYGSKALYVANQIAATGNITAYYSDERLKENLKPIENALDTVKSWTGYHYNANVTAQSFGYDPNKKEIGLLAQEVQRTTPEAVEQAPFDLTGVKGKSLTGKNYLTLKYERLVPVLVNAIKEQDAEIQSLKEQVQWLMEEYKKSKD